MARTRIRTLVAAVVVFSALPPITGLIGVSEASNHIDCEAASYTTRSLSGTSVSLPNKPVFRFVNLSDSHILDDEASAVIAGNWTESVLDPALDNGAAQRLQEEYTDEVLNAMIRTVNVCRNHIAAPKPELMIATGDLSDAATLNETRRYIDNLDGVSGAPTAYEANCGYTTRDSRGVPKLGSTPCTPAMQGLFSGPTGRLVADTQAPTPDPDDPTYQITPTRSARQIAETGVASTAGGSQLTAPGLPAALRCDHDDAGCDNERMAIPHYAVFGNHDGAVRGTVTFQEPFQAGFLAFGRYFLKSQREFINEFFYTESSPGPVGQGSTFKSVGHQFGRDNEDTVTITEFVPNQKVVYESMANEGHFRHWIEVKPADGGAEVTKGAQVLKMRFPMNVMFAIIGPFVLPAGLNGDLKRIKEKLEAS